MSATLTSAAVRQALDLLLSRPEWQQSARMGQFLRFVVERTLAGEGTSLKETVVGVEVFRRDPGYDPKTDPVVRVEARRLRLKLQEYYSATGASDPIRIVLPKGTYQPQFEPAAAATAVIVPVPQTPPTRRWKPGWVAGALILLAGGGWLATRPTAVPENLPTTPRLLTGHDGYSRAPAFSPDGASIVYSRNATLNAANLFIQPSGGGEVRALTTGAHFDFEPAWSPDGRTIAFLRQLERSRFAVMICAAEPGRATERALAEVAVLGPIDWTADSRAIVAADRDDAGAPTAIFAIDVADGRKRQWTVPEKGHPGDTMPHVSPDGRSLAFVRVAEASVQDIYLAPTGGGTVRRITNENNVVAGIAWHPDGAHVIASLQRGGEIRSLWRVPLAGGTPERIADAGIGPISPAVAPKGNRLAFVARLADTNLWRAQLGAEGASGIHVLTTSIELDTGPQISPDGSLLAWRSASSGTNEVWIAGAGGRDGRRLTRMNGPTTGSAHWSPDGKWIVFDSRPNGNGDLFLVPAGGGAPRQLTNEKSNEVLPSFSSDGKSIYFSTDRAGLWEVWRMDSSGQNAVRVAGQGAFRATESPDGRWLYYTRQAGEAGIWRIPAQGGPEEKLTGELASNFWGQWAVSARGLYFAIYPPTGAARAIRRLDLTTRKVTDVLTLAKMPVQFDSGMSVAADESWIVWAQLDQAGSDVYVVDRFR